MYHLMLTCLLMAKCFSPNLPARPEPTTTSFFSKKTETETAKIQVALLLDTSNSMDGLIDQAKSQLWKMVNRLADARRQYKNVQLEIALFEYGNDKLDSRGGYIRLVQPMKTDLDGLSEALFSLKTRGGSEFCGWVIQSAIDSISWSGAPDDLRLIVIAGNEEFTQGAIDYHKSCENATRKDIIVNTIFCGDPTEGRKLEWADCPQIAKGKYLNIDNGQTVRHVATPFDSLLMELNKKLNDTYFGYGKRGATMKLRQSKEDSNAKTYGESNLSQRAMAKAKSSYSNADWDVVDAYQQDSVAFVKDLKTEDLPAEWKGKSQKEVVAEVEKLRRDRIQLRKEMIVLEKKIADFTVEALKKETGATQTLDQVLIETIVGQAKGKGFEF